ncbi:hypothetical protein KFE96_05630 [Kordiimonas sp. SCSIO 12603]|uniref:hypothetical protein n=1 Tax=Kordiimonas sp. SCSIO 12603 TaxID=2829596 RepID=UPI0021052607|nr:hypothetical protein [Kordiimonas sp. SCSIO 12603]UTW59783.1 hypothetical protein KFE96_05630 [Kordiimonas sp. SCSIO 12603]
MSLKNWKKKDIESFIANYKRLGKTEGGKYSLAELEEELRERKAKSANLEPKYVLSQICELSKKSKNGFLFYGDLWKRIFPDEKWSGHKSLRKIADELYAVIRYCVKNDLPIMTALVINSVTKDLTEEAIQNIYEECLREGKVISVSAEKFVRSEVLRAKEFAQNYRG